MLSQDGPCPQGEKQVNSSANHPLHCPFMALVESRPRQRGGPTLKSRFQNSHSWTIRNLPWTSSLLSKPQDSGTEEVDEASEGSTSWDVPPFTPVTTEKTAEPGQEVTPKVTLVKRQEPRPVSYPRSNLPLRHTLPTARGSAHTPGPPAPRPPPTWSHWCGCFRWAPWSQ